MNPVTFGQPAHKVFDLIQNPIAIMKHALALAALTVSGLSLHAQEIRGVLSNGDPLRDDANHYDVHEVKVNSPTLLRVRLNSDDFDSYLIVKTPDGLELTNDDYQGSNSYIEVIAEAPGTYSIWASSFIQGGEGAYTLLIDKSTNVNVDRTEGRLDPRDAQLPKGEYVDVHERTISTTKNFTVRLVCYGFDGFLVVTTPSGVVHRNDDADDLRTSRVTDLVPEAGEWTIHVTTSMASEMGAYDLEIITLE